MIKDIPDWKTAIEEAMREQFGEQLSRIKDEPDNFQEAAAILGKALELLLISKNHKYGKGNIMTAKRFGMKVEQGLLLRENDKTERIINNLTNNIDLGDEDLIEGFGDKTGYSAIGIMLQKKTKSGKNWYELALS